MFSFIDRISSKNKRSKELAKERLQLVLIHDRIDLPIEKLADLKMELLNVITRYVDIDPNLVKINITQNERDQRLIADVPIKVASRKKNW